MAAREYILGINAYHGNASAALLCDGQLLAAAEEERFNRVKYAAGFPTHAVRYCLSEAGISIADVGHVAVPRQPWARFTTKARYALAMPRFAARRTQAIRRFLGFREELATALGVSPNGVPARLHAIEHHTAHLASAFFVSPFERAAVLSVDGLGDFGSAMWAAGIGNALRVGGDVRFPHSLGLYYTALSQYLGFGKYGDEYKVMGLSAYGEPAYLDEFARIVQPRPGVGFRLALDYFTHHRDGTRMSWRDSGRTPEIGRIFSPYLESRLGPARAPDEPLERRHHDIAASLQRRLEDVLLHALVDLQARTGETSLCLAGGVAFNCVANGKIVERTPFERVYVQPAAGDAGLAVGAAFYVHHQVFGRPRAFVMQTAGWGPGFSNADIRKTLDAHPVTYVEAPDEVLCRQTAAAIAAGEVVGWFQGRMEWGPRALGHRSILADPRRADMREILNRRVKHREIFRPFAPSILEERAAAYFEHAQPSPHMTLALAVRPDKRAVIPAPTHVDGTGRLQTVSRETNPLYWQLLTEFEAITGVPAVLNTSFNDNEPIVCTPEEAIDCFLRTRIDLLAIGNHLVRKTERP